MIGRRSVRLSGSLILRASSRPGRGFSKNVFAFAFGWAPTYPSVMTHAEEGWVDAGSVEELRAALLDGGLKELTLAGTRLAISFQDGQFGAISSLCNHKGGPLGKGTLEGDYVVCPWHYYKFHRVTGEGEPGFEKDCVPSHAVKIQDGRLWVQKTPQSKRNKLSHDPHPLSRAIKREPGPLRVVGISTTVMDRAHPRASTSEMLLEASLAEAKQLGAETRLIKLNDLQFRNCEGFYSKHARACTWPCSITEMDPADQMEKVYEALVHWADVICIATPIRWGSASSLYYKMAERLNCVQNAITTHKKVLIQNKVACFIMKPDGVRRGDRTGGQDNVQAVAGQMLGFFSELGFVLPPFPYVALSLWWTAENMERNVDYVAHSAALRKGAQEMVGRAMQTAQTLIGSEPKPLAMGGRKAYNAQAATSVESQGL